MQDPMLFVLLVIAEWSPKCTAHGEYQDSACADSRRGTVARLGQHDVVDVHLIRGGWVEFGKAAAALFEAADFDAMMSEIHCVLFFLGWLFLQSVQSHSHRQGGLQPPRFRGNTPDLLDRLLLTPHVDFPLPFPIPKCRVSLCYAP
jgi:hypothetical protein